MRRKTTPVVPESLIDSAAPSTEDPAAAVADRDAIRILLGHLSEREAQVLACIDVVGLDTASTARALDISATAVRVARHRGLKRLRHLIDDPDVSVLLSR